MPDWHTARELLEHFEKTDQLLPTDAERLIAEIFGACGHVVKNTGFVEGDTGVDCYFDTDIGGKFRRIGAEVKATAT